MKQLPKILTDLDRRDGMTVPEGYFADFASKMAQSLPEKEIQAPAPKRSLWLKVRPYAYMAAMFAGIWLMMQMFAMIKNSNSDLNIENYPALTAALGSDHLDSSVFELDDREIMESLFNDGFSPEDLYLEDDSVISAEYIDMYDEGITDSVTE
ncbi:MAG: hypothetical protein HDS88_01635 [Bacteroidales bacterium]|nr:hypothetical protein [Bacteroidales bacterium]MBD5245694.1 hypothetical protein [Barnesiella sp.]